MDENQIRAIVRQELQNAMAPHRASASFAQEMTDLFKPDRFVFNKHIQLLDARNIQLGKTNGTMIGTQATQKLGFFGVTPVSQLNISTIAGGAAASDGVARNGVNAIISALRTIGLTS